MARLCLAALHAEGTAHDQIDRRPLIKLIIQHIGPQNPTQPAPSLPSPPSPRPPYPIEGLISNNLQFQKNPMGCERSNLVHNTPAPLSPLQPVPRELSGREILQLSTLLEKHILFYKLTHDQRMKLIASMQRFQVQSNTVIFRVNDEPNFAFIIAAGTVRIEIKRQGRVVKKVLREGSIFGDVALINMAKRSATAVAESQCELIALSKENLQRKMEELARDSHNMLFNYIDRAPVFKRLTPAQKKSLAAHMHEARFQRQAVIFHLGDMANCIYLIKSGEVEVAVPNRSPVVLQSGDIFGQGSLKAHSTRRGQAKALSTTNCLVISRNKLFQCVESEDIRNITFHCIIRWALKRTDKFVSVPSEMIEKIIEAGDVEEVEDGAAITTAGQVLTKLMICLEGEVCIEDLFKTMKVEGQDVLGVGCIINEDYECPLKSLYTITKKTQGCLFSIDHRTINALLNPAPLRLSLLCTSTDSDLSLKDFELIRKEESSHFSHRYLVCQKRTKTNYTVLVFNKIQAIQYKRQRLLINDRQINQSLSHRFVINIFHTFKDSNSIYFLYRQHLNFTLDTLMRRVNFLAHSTVQFIAKNMVNLLEFLHQQQVLYRDLKPQNIVIQKDSYPYLVSFMLAKKMDPLDFKTFTIIGTPHYLAPEVQQGFGYSFPADYWSFGVMLYQMMTGYMPFAGDSEDPYDIFLAVQQQKLTFPKNFAHKAMKKLLKLLLSKESWNRPDHTNIKDCEYFKEMAEKDWEELSMGKAKPPEELSSIVTNFALSIQDSGSNLQGSFVPYLDKERGKNGLRGTSLLDSVWDDTF